MKRLLSMSLIALALAAPPALAAGPSEALSNASTNLSTASGLVVTGSMQTLVASGQVVVGAMQVSGETVLLVLRGLANGAEASVKVSGAVVSAAGIAIGTAVSVIAETAGYALSAGGRLIAYLPNEATQALLHQSRVSM
jgi:hypothetical protein